MGGGVILFVRSYHSKYSLGWTVCLNLHRYICTCQCTCTSRNKYKYRFVFIETSLQSRASKYITRCSPSKIYFTCVTPVTKLYSCSSVADLEGVLGAIAPSPKKNFRFLSAEKAKK
jgi:hypothetical protein